MRPDSRITRLALFGAAPDTPNMGVSALFMSAVSGIARHIQPVEFVVFDNGLGRRDTSLSLPDGKEISLIRFGARGGRRYYRPENLATMLLASRLGGLGAHLNEGIRLIDSCAAVLDISGGDSFSDIYGQERFDNINRPKQIAINRGIPLILLPQTYGPFRSPVTRAQAAQSVHGASMAWARDEHSFEILKDLLGSRFNPDIHLCGVDMAFSLPPALARHLLPDRLNDWLEHKSAGTPLVGFNISGLIYNDPEGARSKYGFKADYRDALFNFLGGLVSETQARIVLISHVMDQPGHYESDLSACMDVADRLGQHVSDRVIVSPATLDQSQAKWLISQMDWFCGTRMHATIAGLSSMVPTATISYSDKAKGVFGSCQQADQVFDPRILETRDLIARLRESFARRSMTKLEPVRTVITAAERQSQVICNRLATL
jgi:polysaccharide pyruvyl transferase WcaK-like protein